MPDYSAALRPRNVGKPIGLTRGGCLARDLTLPCIRDGWPETPESAQAGVDEWQETWRNPVRYMPVARDQELHGPGRERSSEHTDQVTQLRDKLSGVDHRPRKTLGGITPAQDMQRLLSNLEKPIVATIA